MKTIRIRKYMFNFRILVLLLFLLYNLTACGAQDRVSQNETKNDATMNIEEGDYKDEVVKGLPSITPKVSDEKSSVQDGDVTLKKEATIDRETLVNVYKSVLKGVIEDHIFPDGQACDWVGDTDLSQNKYAVYDIDQDGKDELIIVYTTASMAGMVELIYDVDYNTKTAREEFREFPALTFYNNNIVQADWSHNQGLGGDFWPFTLYQYNSESDSYDNIAMVDAWDRKLSEENGIGDPFPTDRDVDGDGIVYYIMKDGEYKQDTPIDGEEYKKWRDSYINNASEVTIPFVDLTKDNIDLIK